MMSIIAAIILGLTLLYSSIAKMRDRGAVERTVVDFGLGKRFARPIAVGLPLLEFFLALGLLFEQTRVLAAMVSGVLLGVFTLMIAKILIRRDERPACNCFGVSSSKPVSFRTLLRNTILIGLAILAMMPMVELSLPSLDWVPVLWVLAILEGLGLAIIAWLVANLSRQQGLFASRLGTLELLANPVLPVEPSGEIGSGTGDDALSLHPGVRLPALKVQIANKPSRIIGNLLHEEQATMLLFISQHCGPCQALIAHHLAAWTDESGSLQVHVLPILQEKPSDDAPVQAWLAPGDLMQAGIQGVPAAMLVAPSGVVIEGPVYGEGAIVAMVERGKHVFLAPR